MATILFNKVNHTDSSLEQLLIFLVMTYSSYGLADRGIGTLHGNFL